MPKRVLVIGDSMSLAHVARAIVVAHRLEDEGAEVIFATGVAHQALARQENFDVREVFCVAPEYAHAAIRRGSHIFDYETLKCYVESDLMLFREVQPDLVIGDMRLSLNISAELAGIEYWSILSGYLTRYYDVIQSPPKTFPAVRILGDRISRAVFPVLKSFILRYYASNFRRYRKQLGLSPVSDILDVIASPCRNLIADLPRFIPCSNLPPHFEYIGPLIWEPNLPDPDWLDQLCPDVLTAYVSMGSTGDQDDLRRILICLRDEGWQVMTTTGPHGQAPPGIFAAAFARGSSLLRRSQLLICHGGSGTIYQAISEGVPIVGVATFHDQEINLERAQKLYWGIALDPIDWKEDDLFDSIRRVLTSEYQTAVAQSKNEIRSFIQESEKKPLLTVCSTRKI